MRSRFDESNESAYAYMGGMLNVGYITGFARRGQGRAFTVQQTNDPRRSLPVVVEEKNVSLPADTMPTKVVGRFVGFKNEAGERNMTFRAITLDRPSIRELPNRLAWEKPILKDHEDNFKPFFDPLDDEEAPTSIFYKGEKKAGRPCLNVARVAGFVESYAIRPANGSERNDCLYIALRQTADPDESLPVRVYGRFTQSLKDKLQVALPIYIEGFYRVKVENRGTPEEPKMVNVAYIHCSNIKVATPEDIKVRPAWWNEMKDRLIKASKERLASTQAKPVPVVGATAEAPAFTEAPKTTPAKASAKPAAKPKAAKEVQVDNDL